MSDQGFDMSPCGQYYGLMSKTCTRCHLEKPIEAFHKKSSGLYGVRSECKDCRSAPPKEWSSGYRTCSSCDQTKPNSDFTSSSNGSPRRVCKVCRHRFYNYGLSQERLDRMLEMQSGRCAICTNELGDRFCVDHDHECCAGTKTCGNCIRGLLCVQCNSRLGWYEQYRAEAHAYLSGGSLS